MSIDVRSPTLWKRGLVALLAAVALFAADGTAQEPVSAPRDADALLHFGERVPGRAPIRGKDFPDGVLALTWDDGPDAGTLDLARYLRMAKVSATFFVVGEWMDDISDEPGVGATTRATGYDHLPVLGELVRLGHRLGSHTRNHVLLADAAAVTVAAQLTQGHREIDPFVTNELRMFRPPAGAWSTAAAAALTDPFLADVVGPVLWDIDAKDWDGSLYCRSAPPAECEPGPVPGGTRVRADVIVRRYLAQVAETRRGIVLLHDRVGDVGSRYALDIARRLIPELTARGFVFAAPVLAFSAMRERGASEGRAVFADVDGDGRSDLCRANGSEIVCSSAGARATFGAPRPLASMPADARALEGADVDGDGRADLCAFTDDGVQCATTKKTDGAGGLGPLESWTNELRGTARSFRLADVNGDGRADVCARTEQGIVCATSNGRSFDRPHVWLASEPSVDERLELGDLDGDGRADVCSRSEHGVSCALSSGRFFGNASTWSLTGDFAGRGDLRLADLNGDGRADVCAPAPDGVACALSNGHGFKHATTWSATRATDLRLADLNGDGRADLCAVTEGRLECGLAP